ncbi:MAG: endonuclease/exonuclease/phosphatase family protein [Kiloniellales bacterium]
MRIASYNVNNLFTRAKVMALRDWAENREVLEDVRRLNIQLAKERYDGPTKTAIIEILEKYEFDNSRKRNRPFDIVRTRKKLFSVSRSGEIRISASGRNAWVGWVELARGLASDISVNNTAEVVRQVNADVLVLVEVENRIALGDFDWNFLRPLQANYPHNMLIDGNDKRGIDVCVLSRFPIRSVRSHIDDQAADDNGDPLFYSNGEPVRIFSRDCPEYEIELPDGRSLWILPNHLKSKGYGSTASNDARRTAQSEQVKVIVERLRADGEELIVVAGDLNDTPDSVPLAEVLHQAGLFDVLADKPAAQRWTYKGGGQIDYLLLSAALADATTDSGVNRSGMYSRDGFDGTVDILPTVTGLRDQASDHGAVWADLDL